jgi:leucine dehydrogenase
MKAAAKQQFGSDVLSGKKISTRNRSRETLVDYLTKKVR